jgi:hypothetical protein
MIVEVILEVVGEIVGYATGRAILSVLTPHIHVLPLSKAGGAPKQIWFSLTYTKDGRRYYFEETVTATGVLFWVAIVVAVSVALSK